MRPAYSILRKFILPLAIIFSVALKPAFADDEKFTYVIVHGAWAGGWAFKDVDNRLTADGHKVFRANLTGQGERSHLAAADRLGTNIDLSLHIQDVVNLIVWEQLSNVVLVGHSYGGMVITGVADKIPERLKHVVYLDAFLPENGESLDSGISANPNRPSFFYATNGFVYLRNYDPDKPPPSEVPHPQNTLTEKISLTNQPVAQKIPTTYILTVDSGQQPRQDIFYRFYERAKSRGWPAMTMEGDHNVMWTKPKELVELLEKIPATATASNAPLRRTDANGNPIRRAPTGHISNYDESKIAAYTLPDPLALENGKPVLDANTWTKKRRPELLKLYETEIYGRIPKSAPSVKWSVAETNNNALNGTAIFKKLTGRIGNESDAPAMTVALYLPVAATKPVPVFLHLTFFQTAAPAVTNAARPRFSEIGPLTNILARGYGYATLRYTDIEGDSRTNSLSRVRKLALSRGQTEPASDEWGTISAWAWGASRVLDYFETDRAVDAKRVGVIGHSRLGKTVLWAGARDPRFAIVFSSCSGEMGAALARRDFGETVDDMAANFPWQFAGNFQKYSGRWNDMPVDAHMLIALNAPHPVFITGGTQDQWADPHGEFLAELAATPVYRLFGKRDLGTPQMPLDTPLISGSLGFHYHSGGHTITPADWNAFLDFAGHHLRGKHKL